MNNFLQKQKCWDPQIKLFIIDFKMDSELISVPWTSHLGPKTAKSMQGHQGHYSELPLTNTCEMLLHTLLKTLT